MHTSTHAHAYMHTCHAYMHIHAHAYMHRHSLTHLFRKIGNDNSRDANEPFYTHRGKGCDYPAPSSCCSTQTYQLHVCSPFEINFLSFVVHSLRIQPTIASRILGLFYPCIGTEEKKKISGEQGFCISSRRHAESWFVDIFGGVLINQLTINTEETIFQVSQSKQHNSLHYNYTVLFPNVTIFVFFHYSFLLTNQFLESSLLIPY